MLTQLAGEDHKSAWLVQGALEGRHVPYAARLYASVRYATIRIANWHAQSQSQVSMPARNAIPTNAMPSQAACLTCARADAVPYHALRTNSPHRTRGCMDTKLCYEVVLVVTCAM